ncbi:MAG TPA: hypothetical protein VF618_28660 [Thermoanaerobaculia bacterium]
MGWVRCFALMLLSAAAASLEAQTLDLAGYVALRGVNASGPESWLEDGIGRLPGGGDRNQGFAQAQLGLDWRPVQWFDVHVSGVARHEPEAYQGEAAGLVEAYADLRATFARDTLQLRAGQFFLPTSRENRGELWTSPYTINFSAVNTWIGEEFRPIGVDLEWRHEFGVNALTAGATAFRGNDTMGTLLAWRGWTIGDRLSTYDETLPLRVPPLFVRQRDGTTPFTPDLDGKTGFAVRVRWSMPERGMIQVARVDNQGDRSLYGGEYSWITRFNVISAEIGRTDSTIVAAEYLNGDTGMGFRGSPWVQMDFYAAYVLLSHKYGRNRWTARYDLFDNTEDDFSRAENNSENGRAWTLAWLFDLTEKARAAVEFTQITGERVDLTGDPSFDGRNLTLELRYSF